MLLAEDHLAIGAMNGTPIADTALQGSSDARVDLGVPTLKLFENGHRPQARTRLEHGDDLRPPDIGKRIGPAPLARCRRVGGR